MSSTNVELLRSLYAAWEGGDWSSAEWADPEIELVFAEGPGVGRWTGLAGLAEGWRAFLFRVRDGKVTKLVLYTNREHALADLALAPETGH